MWQTDGQTDILPRHSPRCAYASRGKNGKLLTSFWLNNAESMCSCSDRRDHTWAKCIMIMRSLVHNECNANILGEGSSWSSGEVSGLSLTGCKLDLTQSTASNLKHAANLMYAHVNSASYPQWDEKSVVAYLLWATGKGLVWLAGVTVCLLAALQVQLSISMAMDGHLMCHSTTGLWL